MERAALPGFAQGRQGTEPHVDEQVVRLVDGPRHHAVRRAVVQTVTSQFDGVKRRGAGSVQRKRTAPQPQRMRREVRGQAGVEPVVRVWPGLLPQPHTLRKLRHRRRWKRQVAQHQPRTGVWPLAPGAAQGIAHALQGELKQGVQCTQVLGGHCGAVRIKLKAADVAAPV